MNDSASTQPAQPPRGAELVRAFGERAQAPAAEPSLTRMGELADPKVEAEFCADRFERELKGPMRVSAWSVTLIYASFAPVDWLIVNDVVDLAWALRYGVAVPISIALAVLAMSKHAARAHRFIGVVHSLIGPFLFITVGAYAEGVGGVLYTAWGAVLFPILVPQLTRLGVKWTLIVTVITLAYLALLDVLVVVLVDGRAVEVRLFIHLFFIVGAGYGAWATYAAELAGRRSFWQEKVIAWQMSELASEREKSERLLLNVLPASIADRLRSDEATIADSFEEVTVLFADLVGFTSYSSEVSPEELVSRLDDIFSAFDAQADALGLEKIKTIGDAYMVAGGLPEPHQDAAGAVTRMALAMRGELDAINEAHGTEFNVRVGIHSGEVVAGVIGRRKFIYDLWGDTVNIASRMESHGAPGRVQVSEATAQLLEERFELEARGAIEVKGKGKMNTFWVQREL